LADALAQCCTGPALADARMLFLAYVEGFHAADPAHLSVQWLAEVEENQPAEASELRAVGGAGRLLEILAAELDGKGTVRLGTAAREIRWRPGAVEIVLADSSDVIEADAVIVTVPLPMLKASLDNPIALRFTPAVEEKTAAARQLEMGQVVKLVLRFREPFWREIPPLGDMLFLHLLDEPFPTWWAPTNPEVPLLTAWAGGSQALRLGDAGERTLVDLAVASLARALDLASHDITRRLEMPYLHNWRTDRYAMGAYTYVATGGIDAHRTLARPVHRTLYFAGEATCGAGLNATMEGALQSGWRAADALLQDRD
jgi:monoamine oxidase